MRYDIYDEQLLGLLKKIEEIFYGDISDNNKMKFEMLHGMNYLSTFFFDQYDKKERCGSYNVCDTMTNGKCYIENLMNKKHSNSEELEMIMIELHFYIKNNYTRKIVYSERIFDDCNLIPDFAEEELLKLNGKWFYKYEENIDHIFKNMMANPYLNKFDKLTLEYRGNHIVFFDGDIRENPTIGVKCDDKKYTTHGEKFQDSSKVLTTLKKIYGMFPTKKYMEKLVYTIHITKNDTYLQENQMND